MNKLANYCIRYLDQDVEKIPLEQIFAWNHKGVLLTELLTLFEKQGLKETMSAKEQSFFKFSLVSLVDKYQNILDGENPLLLDIDNGLLVLLGLIISYG